MGFQIIKQPDGLYAIFSSITDTFHLYDATPQDVEDYFVEIATEQTKREVARIMNAVVAGMPRRAYAQFALTWEEALELDREHGGEVWADKAATAEVPT